jgi:hypothetical protein
MATLAEVLYKLPTERLRELVQTRKMDLKKLALIPNKRQLAQFMATELSKPASIAEAIQECNARQLRLLQILLGSEGDQSMPWQDLIAVAGGPALSDSLREVVSYLEDLGLVFTTQRGVFMPEAVTHYVPASLSARYTLVRCLNTYDAMSLKRLCENLGLPADTKGSNIEAIRAALMDHGPGLHLNRPLDAQERAVLEFLVQNGGASTAIEVAVAVQEGQTDDFFRYDWQNRWKQGKTRNAIDRLLGRGILHVVAHGYGYNLFLIIPGDLLRLLSGDADIAFWTGPPPAPIALAVPPPTVTRHTTLTRDVVTLLGFIATQDAARTNTGYIHKTSLKNLARQLSLADERYASFLYALCRANELIHTAGEKQLYTITARGNSWLCWDSVMQSHTLFEAWRKGTLWAEMYADPLEKSNDVRSAETVVTLRQSVFDILSDTESANYYEIATVTDALTYRSPLLLSQGLAQGPNLVPSPAIFVRLLIAECLYWLGMAELGWNEPTPILSEPAGKSVGRTVTGRGEPTLRPALPEASAYRLTPLGAHLLSLPGAALPPEAPREQHFIVQANAEIFVPPYLEPNTLYHLLALTEIPAKGATGNTVSLTRDSIRRCLDNGETIRDIIGFLQSHARTGIPQNVEYLINEVSSKHGHIHIGKAQMYLQVDTPLLLQELQARRELKPYFVRTLGDTVALLQSEDEDKLLRDLRKAGYLPVSDDAPQIRTLGLKTRPAPSPAAPPATNTEKKARRALKADATLDWDRIAQEDEAPWEHAPNRAPISNPIKNAMLIRVMLTQAVKRQRRVEMEYRGTNSTDLTTHFIEPTRLAGNLLTAYDLQTQQETTFEASRIVWARLSR